MTPSVKISAVFSTAMNQATINGTTFTLKDNANNPVAGTVTLTGNTASFTPAAALTKGTVYTANLSTGIQDAAGNALAAAYSWSFTADLMGGSVQGVALNIAGNVTTIAGAAGVTGSIDATGIAARFWSQNGTTTDGVNLYIADAGNRIIRKMNIATGAVSTLAGTAGVIGSADGVGAAASFKNPYGITTDGVNLYVVDYDMNTVRQIEIATGTVTTLAGSAGLAGSVDGIGAAARFTQPAGITTDGVNLYVMDYGDYIVRKIVISSGAVTTIAGTANVWGSADGTGPAASFRWAYGITTDGVNLYIADTFNGTIRQMVLATSAVTTLSGLAANSGLVDGACTAARFNGPQALTTDGTNLYIADTNNNKVRKIVLAGCTVSSVAGSATGALGSADGLGAIAGFYQPRGITVNGSSVFVSDTFNDTIRQIQ